MDSYLLIGLLIGAIVIVLVLRSQAKEPAEMNSAGTNLYYGPSETERYVREHLQEIAETQFPDNPGLEWRVHGFQHTPDLVLAEVEPQSPDVGYSRFKFAFKSQGRAVPEHVATYCLEEGNYVLLSSSFGAPRGLPKRLN